MHKPFDWPLPPDIQLLGEFVELRQFNNSDSFALAEVLTAKVFEHTPFAPLTAAAWPEYALRGEAGGRFTWTVRLEGRIVGTTSYYDVSPYNSHLSIGYTAYAQNVWGTVVNQECKLLLLGYAFEQLGVRRVQLQTDNLNLRSQAAMRAIGATQEGVLRKQVRRTDGTLRDTVVFSILDSEWPTAKERIVERLNSRR